MAIALIIGIAAAVALFALRRRRHRRSGGELPPAPETLSYLDARRARQGRRIE
jgi:hypothetical protein